MFVLISLSISLIFMVGLLISFLSTGEELGFFFYFNLTGAVFFSLLFLLGRHTQRQNRWSRRLLNWLIANSPKIFFGGGAKFHGMLITPHTELIQYKILVSLFFFHFELPSRIYILRHESTQLAAGIYSLLTLLFGWWQFPWGPIGTIRTVIHNLTNHNRFTVAEILLGKPKTINPCQRTGWLDFAILLILLGIFFRYVLVAHLPQFNELETLNGTITHIEKTTQFNLPVIQIRLNSTIGEKMHTFAGGSHSKPWKYLDNLPEGQQVTLWLGSNGYSEKKNTIWQIATPKGTIISYADVIAEHQYRYQKIAYIGVFFISLGLASVILFLIKCFFYYYRRGH